MIEIKESSTDSSSPLKLDKSLSNFNCSFSISEQDAIKGLLYIKKNCIAFISEEQNKEQTIQINFKEINQINYNEEDIEIDMKNENKINLCSFDEINSAIDKIKFTYELFKENDNKDDKNISFSDSDSNFDNDENNKTSLSSKVSLNSSISNDTSTKNIFRHSVRHSWAKVRMRRPCSWHSSIRSRAIKSAWARATVSCRCFTPVSISSTTSAILRWMVISSIH